MTWQLLEGPCEKHLPSLETDSFQLCHFDPPYFEGAVFTGGTGTNPKHLGPRQGIAHSGIFYNHPKSARGKDPDWANLAEQFDRVLNQNGVLILWGNQPRLMQLYQDHFTKHFRFHTEIIWVKTSPNLVISWHKPMPCHENAWVLVKHKAKLSTSLKRTAKQRVLGYSMGPTHGGARQGADGSYAKTRQKIMAVQRKTVKVLGLSLPLRKGGIGNYLQSAIITQPVRGGHPDYLGHPTQKSLDMTKRLISFASQPGDRVLDPMAGSGTTLLACEMLGRNSVGIELNPAFVKLSRERLEAYDGHG